MTTSVHGIRICEPGLVADFFHPTPQGPARKAVILIGGSAGGIPATEHWQPQIARMLQDGYAVLAPAYFKEEGLPSQLVGIPLEFFDKALAWLDAQPQVRHPDVAVVSNSKGGELAMLLASRQPRIQAVAAMVPGAYVFQGIARGSSAAHSSWTWQGSELPFVPFTFGWPLLKGLFTGHFRDAYEQTLKAHPDAAEKARIPVEQIKGPILLLSGRNDEMWPSTPMCEDMMKRLESRNFPHAREHLSFEKDHWLYKDPGVWDNIHAFLKKHYPS